MVDCIMNLDDFKVLSFDCYGTMIDWETGILAHTLPWAQERGLRVRDAEILEAFGQAESAEEAAAPDALYPKVLERVHLRLATQWGLPSDEVAAARFDDSVASWPAFLDSHSALTRLKARYRLVILSNVDRKSFSGSQKRLGVEFDAVYTAETIGSYKPNPRNFAYLLEAERAAGYRREEILHVGRASSTITFRPPRPASPPAGSNDPRLPGITARHHPRPAALRSTSTSDLSANSQRQLASNSAPVAPSFRLEEDQRRGC